MIISWSSGTPDDNMDEGILVNLRETVSRHPWWTARAGLTLALLRQRGILPPASILEAGCGWGTNFERLESAGYQISGLDISRVTLAGLDRPDRKLIEADLSRNLPDDPPLYDCVLALDVIEHIDDDSHALRQLARLVKPSGVIIVSVPALPELYSEFDNVQGHRRRYTRESLTACVRRAGTRHRGHAVVGAMDGQIAPTATNRRAASPRGHHGRRIPALSRPPAMACSLADEPDVSDRSLANSSSAQCHRDLFDCRRAEANRWIARVLIEYPVSLRKSGSTSPG